MSKHNAAFLRQVEGDRPFGSRKISSARGGQMWDSLCDSLIPYTGLVEFLGACEFVGACDPPEYLQPGVRVAFFRRERGEDLAPIAFDAARVAYLCRVTKPSHFALIHRKTAWSRGAQIESILVGMQGKTPLFFLCPTSVDFKCPDRPAGLRIVYS